MVVKSTSLIYLCRPVRKKACEKDVEWGQKKRSSLTGWIEHIMLI